MLDTPAPDAVQQAVMPTSLRTKATIDRKWVIAAIASAVALLLLSPLLPPL